MYLSSHEIISIHVNNSNVKLYYSSIRNKSLHLYNEYQPQDATRWQRRVVAGDIAVWKREPEARSGAEG